MCLHDVVYGLYGYGLYSYGLDSCGLDSHGSMCLHERGDADEYSSRLQVTRSRAPSSARLALVFVSAPFPAPTPVPVSACLNLQFSLVQPPFFRA